MNSKKRNNIIKFLILIITLTMHMGILVYATDNVTVVSSIGRLYSLISSIVMAIGGIVTLWGVFEFATSWQDHNTTQMTAAIKKIVSGLMMAGASAIITYITS